MQKKLFSEIAIFKLAEKISDVKTLLSKQLLVCSVSTKTCMFSDAIFRISFPALDYIWSCVGNCNWLDWSIRCSYSPNQSQLTPISHMYSFPRCIPRHFQDSGIFFQDSGIFFQDTCQNNALSFKIWK